jgi:very-short-patch-repair endonuclease
MDSIDPLEPLIHRPFTLAEARARGVGFREVLRADTRRLSRELYLAGEAVPSLRERVLAHLLLAPDAWASHTTAAALHGLWLPETARTQDAIHLSRASSATRVRRTGVVGHHVRVLPGEVQLHEEGIRLSSPSRTWLDLGHLLGHAALVAVGDQLIREPRPEFERRTRPYATKRQLDLMLRGHRRMKGVAKCRDALRDMRVGADSVPESLLRLSLLAYNFPEPELQIRLHDYDPHSFSADMGFRALRIAIQYDGGHHRSDAQRLSDARRDAAFRAAGWTVIVVTAEDLRDDFARVRGELRRQMRDRAA